MVELSIIVLNWNGWSDTRECLESIYKLPGINFHVFLIDNGSESDYEKMKEWGKQHNPLYKELTDSAVTEPSALGFKPEDFENKPSLFLIKSPENHGFAKGNNIGIRLAEILHVPFVLLLNNDTIVEEDAISKLMTFIKANPGYAAVVPQIRYNDPRDTIWCCGGKVNRFYESYYYKDEQYYKLPLKGHITITFATGCALLLRINESGFLSTKFFFGEEDFELALRFKQQQKKMACVMEAIVYHKESVSIDRSTNYINKMFLHRLNRFVDIKTYAPSTYFFIITYRSFKFLLVNVFVFKTGLRKAIRNSALLYKMALKLKEVNKQTFDYVLNLSLY